MHNLTNNTASPISALKQSMQSYGVGVNCNDRESFELSRSFNGFVQECQQVSMQSLVLMIAVIEMDRATCEQIGATSMVQFHDLYFKAAAHICRKRLH